MARKTVVSLHKQAREKRSRADKLWKDAPNIRVDRFKRSYLEKVRKLYVEADRLDKEADKLAKAGIRR